LLYNWKFGNCTAWILAMASNAPRIFQGQVRVELSARVTQQP